MSRREWIALAAVLLLAAGLRVRFFSGLQVGDDIVYSAIAVHRLAGHGGMDNVHEARTGFIAAIVASYALFGPGEIPLLLYNFLCSTALVAAAAFLARRRFGPRAGGIAGALVALQPLLVYYGTECHTDTAVALWLSLGLLASLAAETSARPKRLLFLAGLLLGWAYLHKETALFLAPVFLVDALAARRSWKYYLPLAAACLGVFLLECAVMAAITGDPFRRYSLIRQLHVGNYMLAEYRTTGSILRRLFVEPGVKLFLPDASWTLFRAWNLIGLAGAIFIVARRRAESGPLAIWLAGFFLFYSFWPSSFRPFLPGFFLFEWTFAPLLVPLACLLAGALADAPKGAAGAAALALLLLSAQIIPTRWRAGRDMAAGPKESYARIRGEPVVVADDKSIEVWEFLEGHRPQRTYVPFQQAREIRGVVVLDKFWTRPGQWWTRPSLSPGPWTKIYESDRVVIYRP